MSRKFSPVALIAIGILLGALSIWAVTMRTPAVDYRTVDILTIFAGGMISGAALANGIMRMRSQASA